ncbi:hypothetical protein [Streptomyces sp. NPDC088789]|uniref:hypothetical protein n=1 Tax=Streptomyces sp. NPDC088789 TaxID=3365899 RepID=UPI0037F35F91
MPDRAMDAIEEHFGIDLETRQITDEMPAPARLTRAQRLGESCVWCAIGAAAAGGMVPLAFVGDPRPSACPRCWEIRLTALRTYLAWSAHTDTCWICSTSRCARARPLAEAHDAARAAVTTRPPHCPDCEGVAMIADQHVVPQIRETATVPVRAYTHTGLCGRPPGPGSPRALRSV